MRVFAASFAQAACDACVSRLLSEGIVQCDLKCKDL